MTSQRGLERMLKEKREKKEESRGQERKKEMKSSRKERKLLTKEKLSKNQVKNHHTNISKLMKKQKCRLTRKTKHRLVKRQTRTKMAMNSWRLQKSYITWKRCQKRLTQG